MVKYCESGCYQRGHGAHIHGFKLATSTFVLSLLNVHLYYHIQQALRV